MNIKSRLPELVVLGILSATVAFGGSIVFAATINVPVDQATIQLAVNVASPGDTIVVAVGIYPEVVTVNKAVILQGAKQGMAGGDPGRTGLPATESVLSGPAGFYVTVSGVTIDGFTVSDGNVFGFGILLGAGTHDSTVVNNIIQENIVGLSLANDSAVAAEQTVIQHNLFRNNNKPGAASGTGIYTDQFNAGGTLQNVLIDDNLFTGNADAGIDFSSTDASLPAKQIAITNNTFDGNLRGMVAFNLVSSNITDNTFQNSTGNTTADIRLFEGVNGLSITGNVLKNGSGRAIRINNIGTGSPDATGVNFNFNSITGYTGPSKTVQVESPGYTGIADGTCNWWGDASGPSGVGPGTGSSVSANVMFLPWWISSSGPCTGGLPPTAIAHDVDAYLSVGKDIALGNSGTKVSDVKAACKNETATEDVRCTVQVSGLPSGCTATSSGVPASPGFLLDDTSNYLMGQTKHFDFKLKTTCSPNLAKGVVAILKFTACADGGVIGPNACVDSDLTPDKSPNVVVKSVKLHK
jgi:hypothetical protein